MDNALLKMVAGATRLGHPRRPFIGRAVSQILFLIAIYLCDLYPRLKRRGPRLAAYLVLLPMGFSVPPTSLPAR